MWKRIGYKVCLVVLSSFLVAGFYLKECRADKVSELQESIQDKQDAVSSAKEQKKQLQSGLTDVKSVISSLESAKKDLSNYITQLDTSLSETEEKITELTELIDAKEEEIEETKEDLEEARAEADEQYESMKKRIKFMYERGEKMYLEMLITAGSFGEMLNKAEYIERLSAYDRRMLDEYRLTVELVKASEEQLEAEQEVLEEAKVEVENEKAALEQLITEKAKQIQAYESDISNKSALVKQYEAEIAAQNAEIAALEAAIAEEKKALEEANGTKKTYDGGMFAWPAPSYTRISDDYGNRIHPTLHVQQFHNGIDLASPGGSPILAAYDGTVVAASYSTTMGNYIMIDHGDNLYTIYMHASALYVSKGTEVSRGQKIAAVGSTGRSTGNHLHFSVRVNGAYVSPWNYLSK